MYGARLVSHPVLLDPSAQSIRERLAHVAADSKENEPIVVVYSGRGFEHEGRKYLTAADTRPLRFSSVVWSLRLNPVGWDPTTLVAIGEIAKTFQGRDLVMVADAQFSEPRQGETSPLDKHVASIEGGVRDAPAATSGTIRFYPAPFPLRRHVYVWWEGRLREAEGSLTFANLSDTTRKLFGALSESLHRQRSSSLTRALVKALAGAETYRDWLERASVTLRNEDSVRGWMAGQGPTYRPLMAAGSSVDDAIHIALQLDRTEANLELGAEWSRQHAGVWALPL